jgi:hypothetical protein
MRRLTNVLSQQVGRSRLPAPPGWQGKRAAGMTAALPCRVRRLPLRVGALAHCTWVSARTGTRASPLSDHDVCRAALRMCPLTHMDAWRGPGGGAPRKRARITRGALLDGADALQLEIGIVGARDAAGGECLEVRARSAPPFPCCTPPVAIRVGGAQLLTRRCETVNINQSSAACLAVRASGVTRVAHVGLRHRAPRYNTHMRHECSPAHPLHAAATLSTTSVQPPA